MKIAFFKKLRADYFGGMLATIVFSSSLPSRLLCRNLNNTYVPGAGYYLESC
jgi:hypothetical protein